MAQCFDGVHAGRTAGREIAKHHTDGRREHQGLNRRGDRCTAAKNHESAQRKYFYKQFIPLALVAYTFIAINNVA